MTNGKPDEFDRMLDAALAKYAAVEPRTGLEERVLANLRPSRRAFRITRGGVGARSPQWRRLLS
jgi:hypothetical protein